MIAILLAATISVPNPDAVVLVSDPAQVASCERVGEFSSSSILGGLLKANGYRKALNGIKRKAAAQGATHLHLLNAQSGYGGSQLLGIGYRCPKP